MAAYQIAFTPAARRQLASLDLPTRRRIGRRIEALGTDPRPSGAEMLKGGEGDLRIRVGDWRVIYVVQDDELLVLVIKIGHRGEVYRAR
ncbi:MAG: type II toxin-antitoxin system RelE family toxin [Candidatus Rokuibacteriota bacterium]